MIAAEPPKPPRFWTKRDWLLLTGAALLVTAAWVAAWNVQRSEWLLEHWMVVPLPADWCGRIVVSLFALVAIVQLFRHWNLADTERVRRDVGRTWIRLWIVLVGLLTIASSSETAADQLETCRAERAVATWNALIAAGSPAARIELVKVAKRWGSQADRIEALRIGLGTRDSFGWRKRAELWWMSESTVRTLDEDASSWISIHWTDHDAYLEKFTPSGSVTTPADGSWWLLTDSDSHEPDPAIVAGLRDWRGVAR